MTREEIGVFAQARTALYFRGEKYSVGYKNLEELMQKGTDIILIEKEGMAEVLRPFTDAAGIAVLNSIGFVARYASRLAKFSEKTGANIAMVTDFDVSGLSIHRDLPSVYRIGIDFDTLEYFGLEREDVEERYSTSDFTHFKGLQNMGPAEDEDPETFYENLEYVKTKRIEIDSVVRKVGNEPFWQFIVDKLTEEFPTRDYNRAIVVPRYVDPDELIDLVVALRDKIKIILEDMVQEITDILSNTEGILEDIVQEESDIEEELKDVVSMDSTIGPILDKIQKLVKKLKDDSA